MMTNLASFWINHSFNGKMSSVIINVIKYLFVNADVTFVLNAVVNLRDDVTNMYVCDVIKRHTKS